MALAMPAFVEVFATHKCATFRVEILTDFFAQSM